MSDEQNTYQYIIQKQAMLNVDSLNERIAELEAANTFLKEQNDNLSSLTNKVGSVYRSQNLGEFIDFINNHLLSNDLAIEFHEEDEEGLVFHIPEAALRDGFIGRQKQSFTVSGTVMLDWTVEVTAEDESDAHDIAERHIDGADFTAYFPHHEQVDEADIDNYNLTIEVTDICEN
jgi:hypothetical protein